VRRPRREALQLVAAVRLEERADAPLRLLQSREANVVAPPLEQRVAHRAVVGAEGAGQQREVFPDQLLLQVDGVGRDDGALAVHHGPPDRRHEVREALPDPRPGLEHCDRAVVVRVGDVGRHVALGLAVLVRAQLARHGARGREEPRNGDGIEWLGAARLRHLDNDVQLVGPVVHDPEADAAVVQAHGDVEVGVRGLEQPARVVVEHHLSAGRDARQGQHRVHGAACDRFRPPHRAIGGDVGDERDLAAAGLGDRRGDGRAGGGAEPRRAHVLSSRFRAAGKSTLLRMSR
jgi:hypothetical protein